MADAAFSYKCDCGAVTAAVTGAPKFGAICHCGSCRLLTKAPFYNLTAWEAEQVQVTEGEDKIVDFKLPTKEMHRVFCSQCGTTVFTVNKMGWRLVPAYVLAQSNGGELQEAWKPTRHFFYADRHISVDDDLQK